MEALIAKKKAAKQATAAAVLNHELADPAPKAAAPAPAPSDDPDALSDEDFYAKFGVKA